MRGPQGTLFGKNATGGVINVMGAKPGGEFESSLLQRAGDHGQQDIRGMVNVPINDTVAHGCQRCQGDVARVSYGNRFFGENFVSDRPECIQDFVPHHAGLQLHDRFGVSRQLPGTDVNAPGRCNDIPESGGSWTTSQTAIPADACIFLPTTHGFSLFIHPRSIRVLPMRTVEVSGAVAQTSGWACGPTSVATSSGFIPARHSTCGQSAKLTPPPAISNVLVREAHLPEA